MMTSPVLLDFSDTFFVPQIHTGPKIFDDNSPGGTTRISLGGDESVVILNDSRPLFLPSLSRRPSLSTHLRCPSYTRPALPWRCGFDVVLTIVADTLYRLLAKDLKRFEECTPKTIFSDFINCKCNGEVVGDEIIIKMKKKATTPIFKFNDIFQKSYPVPWLGNKRLRFDWIS